MVSDAIILDTGPLIFLTKIEAQSFLSKMPYAFIAPQAVLDELISGDEFGYRQVDVSWLQIMPSPKAQEIFQALLGEGEAAVIQLALQKNISLVCLDDLRARRIAKNVGLQVTGVLGLLRRAKILAAIPALRPYVERLLDAGAYYSPKLVASILRDAGE